MKKRLRDAIGLFIGGLQSAEKILTSDDTNEAHNITAEQHVEVDNVWSDLLRGEVTERVKELRHEMYYAERESKKYEYKGNGTAVRKNNIFDVVETYFPYEDYEPHLIQKNYCVKGNEDYCEVSKYENEYVIELVRDDFIPRFRLEEYVTNIVFFRISENDYILDLYIPQGGDKFDRRVRQFQNEMQRIFNGDARSDILDFESIQFITTDAFGADDFIYYSFKRNKYISCSEYNGNYILRFSVTDCTVDDLVSHIYHEATAKKLAEHAPRECAVKDFGVEAFKMKKAEDTTLDEQVKLIESEQNH